MREGKAATFEGGNRVPSLVRWPGNVPAGRVCNKLLTNMDLLPTLLAVAVVIALLGVGNTLALSVVERRQESGLLRALGLTRGQLRAVLAWEALLVAGVAAVLGVVLGLSALLYAISEMPP